jgi:phosphoglucomutase
MNFETKYKEWLEGDIFDAAIKKELEAIKEDSKEIEDRFYKDLEFGTGGLRGMMGAGTNRMNRYTVGRATQGLANYIHKKGIREPRVAIAYDCRRLSKEFAAEAASVLNGNGIKVYIFEDLRPTPELSFAVRTFKAAAGIVVTASHNPPEYNGYKVYWSDGAQIVSPMAEELLAEVNSITDFTKIKRMDRGAAEQQGLLELIGEEIDGLYVQRVKGLSLNPQLGKEMGKSLSLIYTPLHGTGNLLVRRVLSELGYENVTVVAEQELPDGDFPTVKSPNPEEHEAFSMAIKLGKEKNADLIIGTDPDCDRIGAVVKNKQGEYAVLTGNQTGALLIDYMLHALKEKNKLNDKSTIVNTVVTGKLGEAIATSYGVEVVSVLTGFKYIGEKIKEFQQRGDKEFVFGYEESYGYLAGDFVRDKDAVIAAMLICEMAAFYKQKGMNLYDGMMALYDRYGYYKEGLGSISFKGKEGMEGMRNLMDNLRQAPAPQVNGVPVAEFRDYMTYKGELPLPRENMLCFILEDRSWFCIRPSGTEPKLKLYYSVIGSSPEEGEAKLEALQKAVLAMIGD